MNDIEYEKENETIWGELKKPIKEIMFGLLLVGFYFLPRIIQQGWEI